MQLLQALGQLVQVVKLKMRWRRSLQPATLRKSLYNNLDWLLPIDLATSHLVLVVDIGGMWDLMRMRGLHKYTQIQTNTQIQSSAPGSLLRWILARAAANPEFPPALALVHRGL
jgi:hypothetical protein